MTQNTQSFAGTISKQASSEFRVENAYEYDKSSPSRWVISHALRYKGLIFSFITLLILSVALYAAVAPLTGLAFDEVLKEDSSLRRLTTIAGIILICVLLRGAFDLLQALSIETLGQRLERDAREELYLSLLSKSQSFHNRQRVGDIMARATNDVRQLNPMVNPGFSLLTESIIGIIIPVIFIAFIQLELLLAPLLFVITFIFALRLYMQQLNPVAGGIRFQFGQMNAGLTETITGIEVVKATAQEAQEKQKFIRNATNYRDWFVREGKVRARYIPTLLISAAIAIAFAHSLFLFSQDKISLGSLVAYMALMGSLRFPAGISIFTFSLVQLGLAGAKRILEMMDETTDLDENTDGVAKDIKGNIVFDNVTFYHQKQSGQSQHMGPKAAAETDNQATLKNLNFTIEAGQTVAIVGQTGSGKTTLTKLVNRIYDANDGTITIDGVDVKDWNMASLRSQISVIEQDIFLFSRKISENISFGLTPEEAEDTTQEDIVDAAKAAQADGFIRNFADGYDTVIGERGVTLSGGQRQRLAIARAILTNPNILILDDSTSAIDSATEDEIQKAINKVLEGRTTLIITHRLSQIRKADKIIVLHHGEIVDQGSHAELLDRCSLYQRIFRIGKTQEEEA